MKELISIAEAASYLKMPLQSVYKLTSKRLVPFYKPGKRILFDVSELDAWLLQSKKATLTDRNSPINSKLKS
jgi:excisionase family DNA binding protein